MEPDSLIADTENELRVLAGALTEPRERECLLCYVYRMLEYHCSGTLQWAARYRDLRAPRATGLERRLEALGGFCDCEIFLNGYDHAPEVRGDPSAPDPLPDQLPPCRGARAGSTKGCTLWVRLSHVW